MSRKTTLEIVGMTASLAVLAVGTAQSGESSMKGATWLAHGQSAAMKVPLGS